MLVVDKFQELYHEKLTDLILGMDFDRDWGRFEWISYILLCVAMVIAVVLVYV